MVVLKIGSKGEEVKRLQRLLGIGDDGIFGYGTERAVKDFQRRKMLYVDGVVGRNTWEELLKDISKEDADINIIDAHINTHITLALGRKIKYIAIHYTAGGSSKKGTAMATRNVFITRQASADFVVDDAEIVRINPDVRNYYCWAVGDKLNSTTGGGRLHGMATNKNTISIEICSNLLPNTTAAVPNHGGWYFTDAALNNALKLVRYLMREYDIPKENVVRHYDITGKLCPGIISWNDYYIYDTKGKITSTKNNSKEWEKFWNEI